MRRWREYPWTSPWFRAKLWLMGKFGKMMNCGCRGYCRGHPGGWLNVRIISETTEVNQ